LLWVIGWPCRLGVGLLVETEPSVGAESFDLFDFVDILSIFIAVIGDKYSLSNFPLNNSIHKNKHNTK
jgi:hypothetical protein